MGINHQVLPGKEGREQSIRDLGSAKSSAQQDAKSNANSGTVVATCDTGSCPPPECKDITTKINELANEFAKRGADMLADRPVSQGGLGIYDLFQIDPFAKVLDPRGIKPDLGNWNGHGNQIT